MLSPTVPPSVFRSARSYRWITKACDAINNFATSVSRDRSPAPAMQAGLFDLHSQLSEMLFGDGNLAHQSAARVSVLVQQAKTAMIPSRRRKKIAIERVTAPAAPAAPKARAPKPVAAPASQ